MRLILAGNYEQFRQIARPDDKYLANLPDDLLGHSSCYLIETGTFFVRPDFKPEEIYYYCVSHEISVSPQIKRMAKVLETPDES